MWNSWSFPEVVLAFVRRVLDFGCHLALKKMSENCRTENCTRAVAVLSDERTVAEVTTGIKHVINWTSCKDCECCKIKM